MLQRDLFQASSYCKKNEYSGPVRCNDEYAWLGSGYYFWDNNVKDAHWWGTNHYNNNYIITKTAYDYHSTQYLDLASLQEHKEYLFRCYKLLKERSQKLNRQEVFTVGRVIEILKKTDKSFNFLAIRACPIPKFSGGKIYFDRSNDYFLLPNSKFQVCVIDKSFLIEEPQMIFSSPIVTGQI